MGANRRRGGSDEGKRRIQDRAKGRRIRGGGGVSGAGAEVGESRVEGEVAETGVEGVRAVGEV